MRWSVLLSFAFAACNASSGPPGAVAIHDLHEPSTPVNVPTSDDDFYRLPFPNALWMGSDGTVDLSRHPRAGQPGALVPDYIDTIDAQLTGFGENSAIYFRFDAAIDPTSLPADANASLQDASSVIVVDVTPMSPTYGKRSPVQTKFTTARYDFIGPNWLGVLPFPGIPLRQNTTYAVILTDALKAADGGKVHRYPDFIAAMQKNTSSDPRIAAAQTAYQPLVAWLATQPGLAAHVVNATVYTTRDATSIMTRLRKNIYDVVAAPTLLDLAYNKEDVAGVNQLFEAHYMGPNYQQGDPPYNTTGGEILSDANGVPMLDRMEDLRLALSIPEGTMPTAGWPVVIYAHGTGGDYHDFINDGSAHEAASVTDGSGAVIAKMAMLGIDQVLAGPRDPTMSNPDLTFFNFQNPAGARFNPIQGALDDFQLMRLIQAINVAAAPTTGAPIKFDTDRIYFKGHSQGSLTGSLFLAAEPNVKSAVLSGCGAVLILSLLTKTEPVDVAELVASQFLDPVDQFHPVLSLLQAYLEDSDPANYVRYLFSEPPTGFAPKNIFQSLGIVDHYAPIPTNKAQALATGIQPINPMQEPIDGMDLLGINWGNAPTSLNVAGGSATGVLVEYQTTLGEDGHFVVLDEPAGIAQSNRFLATHAATGVSTLTVF